MSHRCPADFQVPIAKATRERRGENCSVVERKTLSTVQTSSFVRRKWGHMKSPVVARVHVGLVLASINEGWAAGGPKAIPHSIDTIMRGLGSSQHAGIAKLKCSKTSKVVYIKQLIHTRSSWCTTWLVEYTTFATHHDAVLALRGPPPALHVNVLAVLVLEEATSATAC